MDAKQVHNEVTRRFGKPDYPNPARPAVSYMIAPVMRGFTRGTEPVTMNMPHYMFYAPGVTNSDIGGEGDGQYSFLFRITPGRDAVYTQLVGETGQAEIFPASADPLAALF